MLTLYFSPGACSTASHIAIEETGIPYKTVRLDLAAGDQRRPEYLQLNPRGRVPTLVVDGHTLTENVGIMTYIAGGYPHARIWPADTWHQGVAVSTMAWLSNTVHTTYGHLIRAGRSIEEPVAFIERGSTDRERIVIAKLREVARGTVDVESPAVMVIGQVVRLRRILQNSRNTPTQQEPSHASRTTTA